MVITVYVVVVAVRTVEALFPLSVHAFFSTTAFSPFLAFSFLLT